jgi:prepilin-type N-terminal cleavage/methylation domain-containing protein
MKNRIANEPRPVAHFRPVITLNPPLARRKSPSAFTLIELLVVIAIIAILAGLTVGLLPGIQQKRTRSAVRAQMVSLETAINNFKQKKGFYPPDNPGNPGTNALFYELTGTEENTSTAAYIDMLGNQIPTNVLGINFGVAGIQNSVPSGSGRQVFFPNLKSSAYAKIPGTSPDLFTFVASVKGPDGLPIRWQYNSSNPTHNADSFDLWIVVDFGKGPEEFGNWK